MTSITSPVFSNLSIKDADVPRNRVALSDNPFAAALRASAEKRSNKEGGKWEGQGKQATIPAADAPDAERLIRQAAEGLGIGSAVRMRTTDGRIVDIVSVGAVQKPSAKPGGKPRMSGGTPTAMVAGKQYSGDVVCYFMAKSPRDTSKPAAPAVQPAAPAAQPTMQGAPSVAEMQAATGGKPAATDKPAPIKATASK